MTSTARLFHVSLALATAAMGLGYGLDGYRTGAAFFLVLGALWVLAWYLGWGWGASVALACFVGGAAVGLWMRLWAGWMLIAVVGALTAWDLNHFARRSRRGEEIAGNSGLERAHLRRLLSVDGLGLLLAGSALLVRVRLRFAAVFCLALLAAFGLSRVIGFLRREGDRT